MGRYIVKLNEYYFEYSTVVDAPVTFGMSLDEFKGHYRREYGALGMNGLDERLRRVEQNGTSCRLENNTPELVMSDNRAGPDESRLTLNEIYKAYCLRLPIRDGWLVPEAK